jgi:hypothetical protein
MKTYLLLFWTALFVILPVDPQQAKAQQGQDAHHAIEARGDEAMGFSREKTTHHFRLYHDGGAIEVTANHAKDTGSRNMIRMHLSHIAKMFSDGNFDTPMFIHGATPPGVPVMKELREQIRYGYEDIDLGGRVRIRSANSKALEAVHDFLKFQIAEHKTADSTAISEDQKAHCAQAPVR